MGKGGKSARGRGFDKQSARQAVAIAEEYQTATLGMLVDLQCSPQLAPILHQLAPSFRDAENFTAKHKERLIRSLGPNGRVVVNSLQNTLLAAERIFELLQHRVVYRVHPELAESLADTEPGATIPCEVFCRLPHPDPFVVFPTPLPAPHDTGSKPVLEPPVYMGMLVTGLTNQLELCSTADPRLHMLTVALISRVHFEGSEPHYPWYGIEIPCFSERFTIEEMIRGVHRALKSSDPAADPNEIELNAYRLAVSLLLYLCSDRRDISAPTEVTANRKKRHVPGAASTVIDVGFDIGPKLFAARQAASAPSADSGKRVRPHIRRAHWHTYWTGPREQPTADVRWLHPILVHPEDRDPSRAVVIDTEQRRS
ncbi:hypothetical protein IU500_34480 [Nocardia terpenica]|uniref:hypothetical protein n=1 Tax=Nocardia terpenica TaxID=455432 RepID=UPI001894B8FA|nr:hypothetical protein [Nocardia terpenica]MBF6065441.1 hypothetical protein [Nocardia terpenica]MBF6109123.1 hypothetical protein [Nocardia terpenica]MBF6114675.1 hypothetical protein [Nocardia terpenica]MBF6123360.1 hypothetical protein [Nocardia terpenica]MBF6156622.1 hypothetical protein [Nocardia terpenica]